MGDLAAFYAARLDEDEANAEAALAQWADTHFTIDPGSLVIVGFHRTHDPARVLREVAAGRAILAAHQPRFYEGPCADEITPTCMVCITDRKGYQEEWPDDDWPCATVRAAAAVYSDHPGYDPAWAVSG